MFVFQILVGVLMVFCGCHMLFQPDFSATSAVWFIVAVMFISGLASIIHFIEAKNAEKIAKKSGKAYLPTGIGSLLFGIGALALAILCMTNVIAKEFLIILISVLFGVWVIFNGISSIIAGVKRKRTGAPGWVAMIILGVLLIVIGGFCVANAWLSWLAMGTVFGVSMMMAGFMLLFF